MSLPLTSMVLRLLLPGHGPRSGQEMAGLLGCSRAAVSKAVAALRDMGFVVDSRPNAGYTLVSEPDELLPPRLEARLSTGSLGLPYHHFMTTDSTNLQARRLAEAGAPHGACVVAEQQSAGRGRLDRGWASPPGAGLLMSLVLRPELAVHRAFVLNNVISLAICRAVEQVTGLTPSVKWPNDVYLGHKKLVGILTEFTSRGDMVDHAVVGAGINVNWSAADLERLPAPAASLMAESGRRWDRAVLLRAVLAQATALYADLCKGGPAALTAEYRERNLLLGRQVVVDDSGQLVTGQVADFLDDGAMVLQTEGGPRVVRHGDVTLRSIQGLPGRE